MGFWDFISVWAKHFFFDKWVTFQAKIPFVIIGVGDVLVLQNHHIIFHIYTIITHFIRYTSDNLQV